MSAEKPTKENANESPKLDLPQPSEDVVLAEIVQPATEGYERDSGSVSQNGSLAPNVATATVVNAFSIDDEKEKSFRNFNSQPLGPRLENLAAKGGAVAAIVLAVLAMAGSFVTSWSIINAGMGLACGIWGLRSQHKKMAGIGILLCLIAAFLCAVEISDWLESIWPVEEEIY